MFCRPCPRTVTSLRVNRVTPPTVVHSAILWLETTMSSWQEKYVIPKIPCPECGAMISENDILEHWRLHLSNESEGQSSQPILGFPLAQQQRSTPANPSPEELATGNRMPSTPSESSSNVSLTTKSTQYAVAAAVSYTHLTLPTIYSV